MRFLLSALALTLCTPVASAQPCEQDTALTVATFNAWGLPAPIAPRRKSRLAALGAFADELGADVVGLQEVWKGARPLIDLPGLLLPSLSRGDTGLGLATDLPTRRERVHHFRDASGVDRLKKKGVLEAEVELGERSVPVLVTHLQAGESARAARVRQSQITELLSLANTGPVLLMGDLNLYTDLDRESVAMLEDAGFVDAAAATGVVEPTYRGGEHRLDRVLVRADGDKCLAPRAVSVVTNELSDHHAVVVELGG